tara:strand:+ start:951 stop:1769 length:819 start_codon:yes stop_codon:yes gene_type:complete
MRPADLIGFKKIGAQITMLTAWDSISSAIVEAAGVDIVLVGDSLAMVALGHSTTLPVTLDQMIHHTQAVERGFRKKTEEQPLLICDLPFLSYQCGEDKAVSAAGKLLKQTSAAGVKVEGAAPEILKVIKRLVSMGIPVMGHLGLTPQSVNQLGYKKQGEDNRSQEKIFFEALQLEESGCFSIVIEHTPQELASRLKNKLNIPIIGIGAGNDCDGQVIVTADLLGLTEKQPPFAQPLIRCRELCISAIKQWVDEQQNQGANPTTTTFQSEPDY